MNDQASLQATPDIFDKIVSGVNSMKPLAMPDGGDPVIIIPDKMTLKSLAEFLPPKRIERIVTLQEAESFCSYVNRFKTDNSLIFCNVSETGCSFKAILDYHSPAPDLKPDYCEHTANFTAIETPEWKVWKAANRQAMSQVQFATWLEDNSKLFIEPDGADLLELVRTLHGHRNARFNTSLRLDTGAYSVEYDEDIVVKGTSTTRAGKFDLPPVIKAGLGVFLGGEKYEISARLKSRCEDRSLSLFFETIAFHEIVRESTLRLVKQVAEKTEIIPLLGNP